MSNRGYRSIEVTVTNDTPGNLTVQAPQLGSGCSWIGGEEPTAGQTLGAYQSMTWGVSTNDARGAATAGVSLWGLGAYPVTIGFSNDVNGDSSCQVLGNNTVSGASTSVSTGEANHSAYAVRLTM